MTSSEMFSQICGGIIASKSAHKHFRLICTEQEAIILYSQQNGRLAPHSWMIRMSGMALNERPWDQSVRWISGTIANDHTGSRRQTAAGASGAT